MNSDLVFAIAVGVVAAIVFSNESFRVQMSWALGLAFLSLAGSHFFG
jgi:hypothetical protein